MRETGECCEAHGAEPCRCCRSALPTYEAWTFGLRHAPGEGPPGPGTGKYGVKSALGETGFRYGPGRKKAREVDPGPMAPDNIDYLSTIHGPHYSFGDRHPADPNKNPGPTSYKIPVSWKAKTSSWGPPPSVRQTIKVPITYETPLKDTRLPISFKGPHTPPKADITPAPHDYQKRCLCDCAGCCQSQGPSFGTRHKSPPIPAVPGPSMLCNTLGVATTKAKCGSFPHL